MKNKVGGKANILITGAYNWVCRGGMGGVGILPDHRTTHAKAVKNYYLLGLVGFSAIQIVWPKSEQHTWRHEGTSAKVVGSWAFSHKRRHALQRGDGDGQPWVNQLPDSVSSCRPHGGCHNNISANTWEQQPAVNQLSAPAGSVDTRGGGSGVMPGEEDGWDVIVCLEGEDLLSP